MHEARPDLLRSLPRAGRSRPAGCIVMLPARIRGARRGEWVDAGLARRQGPSEIETLVGMCMEAGGRRGTQVVHVPVVMTTITVTTVRLREHGTWVSRSRWEKPCPQSPPFPPWAAPFLRMKYTCEWNKTQGRVVMIGKDVMRGGTARMRKPKPKRRVAQDARLGAHEQACGRSGDRDRVRQWSNGAGCMR